VRPGLINLDFADVRAVMDEMGKAMMGTGEATGDDRAIQAAEKAIANPLLDEISLNGAKGVLINITGGHDLTLFELDEAANIIREKVDPEANIIVGSTLDTGMEGRIRVSVVATGIDASAANKADVPVARRSMGAPLTLTPVHQPETPRAAAPAPMVEEPAAFEDEIEAIASVAFDAAATRAGIDEEDLDDGDDLPMPAFRPQTAAQPTLVRATPAAIEADPSGFVAPRPRVAGQPSPEALARLQAAVSRPSASAAKFGRPTPVAATPAPAAAAAPKPRFGIGSLINRMAGHLETTGPAAPTGRAQPPVTAYDDDHDMGSDQDRIEIPAFLRRQAN
jgi:cell division protein FtsZ